ncbi:MAG: hypothetical protein Q9178_006247 [Gyalolechia marmorata]
MRPQAQTDIPLSGTKARPTFIKTDFQHIGGKHAGIAADPDVGKHQAVRKMLAPAFNPRALKEQEPALHDHVNRFIGQLAKLGTIDNGVDMRERFPLLYPLVFLALPPKLATTLPTLLLKSNLRIVQDRFASRKDVSHPDYFSLLLPEDQPVPPDDFLVAQANHLIVGGFAPDTNLFMGAVHYLLENLKTYERLRDDIRGTFSSWEQISNDALQSLPYLHSVI